MYTTVFVIPVGLSVTLKINPDNPGEFTSRIS